MIYDICSSPKIGGNHLLKCLVFHRNFKPMDSVESDCRGLVHVVCHKLSATSGNDHPNLILEVKYPLRRRRRCMSCMSVRTRSSPYFVVTIWIRLTGSKFLLLLYVASHVSGQSDNPSPLLDAPRRDHISWSRQSSSARKARCLNPNSRASDWV